MSQQNVDIVRSAYDAFGRGDIPAIIALLDEDVAWNSPATLPWGGNERGPDGALAFFGRLGGAVEELTPEIRHVLDAGDHVVVTGIHRGRAKGGSDFEAEWAMVWELRDGKVTSFSDYVDTAAVAAAYAGVTT